MSLTYTNRGPSPILTDNAAQWPGSTRTRCTTFVPPPSWLARPRARLRSSLLGRRVSTFVVWPSAEVEDYARELRLPREKLVYLPFHHTLRGYDYTVGDDGPVFAGGAGGCDYGPLRAARQQTCLNAMARGRAVVVCDERGAPDYIPDGVTGLVVPAGDPDRLAQ